MSNQKDPKEVIAQAAQQQKPGISKEDLKEIIEAVLPAAVAAVSAGQQAATNAKLAATASAKPKCPECLQPNMACGGKHRKMVVFIGGPYSRWFQGCQLNGVRYLSDHPAHMITVPEDTNFEYQMQMFHQSEERFATGRTFQHNSGQIAPANSSGFVPAVGPTY